VRAASLKPLRERDFRLLFAAQGVSIVGDAIDGIAIAFAALAVTGSASGIGFVLAARALPLVAFLLLGGLAADRLRRQRVMLSSDLVRGAVQAGTAVLLASGHASLGSLIALQAVYGAGEAFFRPALGGIVPQTVSRDVLQQANALLGMTPSAGIVLGSALGGILVALLGTAGAIAVDAATFGVSALLLLQMRTRASPRAATERVETLIHQLRVGFREFASRRWIVVCVLGESAYSLIVMPVMFVLGPVISQRSLGGATAWSAIVTGFGIGTVGGGVIALRLRPRRPLVTGYLAIFLLIPHFSLIALTAPVWLISLAAIPSGVSVAIWETMWQTTLHRLVPGPVLSRVMAYNQLGSFALFPLGLGLAGALGGAIGPERAFWLASAAVAVSTAAVLSARSVRAITGGSHGDPAPAAAPPLRSPG
jgi:MFS family permease